ncbi:hypothetical protein EMQU_0687 [Enterococcus mundtii QU 25]|uniref:Uncharacterized protein n=1 Tax=Enterococcus mundtii TaxID=53346 RepID=A0AAI8RB16_ENTMU|nr:hypothetical protein EMQU_0687 [Enterococcus mundtii QU 25]BBM15523.1 uncharacterized protein EM151A_2342 [Enterococcus mundtii]
MENSIDATITSLLNGVPNETPLEISAKKPKIGRTIFGFSRLFIEAKYLTILSHSIYFVSSFFSHKIFAAQ